MLYINTSADHPPQVIKQLNNSINKRLCENSANEQVFNTVKPVHENGLHKSGYKNNLKHSEEMHQHSSNKRTQKITWFNPPFSQTVKTKIANLFFRLLNKHFPKSHLLHKIFNRNTIKVSYSCMNNVSKCKNEGSYFYKNKKYRELEKEKTLFSVISFQKILIFHIRVFFKKKRKINVSQQPTSAASSTFSTSSNQSKSVSFEKCR